MLDSLQDSIALARTRALRLSITFIGVLVLWLAMTSGIPFMPQLGLEIPGTLWLQTLTGIGFVAALGWLLYLPVEKGLHLIARMASIDFRSIIPFFAVSILSKRLPISIGWTHRHGEPAFQSRAAGIN